jgi:putative ABC transport system ATP-binding protein
MPGASGLRQSTAGDPAVAAQARPGGTDVTPAISIRNLNHYFGAGELRKQILFDISADINPGEIVINTGPSGSGKTTMLTLVCGLRSVQEGSVKTLGLELNGARPDTLVQVRRNIGFIFQAHNLLGALTACQNVQMGANLDGAGSPKESRDRSVEMLSAVGLSHRVDHYPHQLSGGQKQRVAIARALVRQPKIVLADEPTAALDKTSGREVVELLQRLASEQGCAILLVTHDNRILDIADRILTLEDGKISSFTSGIAATTEHLMSAFTGLQRKGELERHLRELPDKQFLQVLEQVTSEFESLLRTMDVLNAEATRALVEQVTEVTAIRMRELLGAERATVYLVDRKRNVIHAKIAHHTGPGRLEIQMPIGTGIAGKVAESGATLNLADAYSHPDFNPEFDMANPRRAELGVTAEVFLTKSILCMPIFDRKRQVIGVAQLLNKRDSTSFGPDDERVLQEFAGSLGISLETCNQISST